MNEENKMEDVLKESSVLNRNKFGLFFLLIMLLIAAAAAAYVFGKSVYEQKDIIDELKQENHELSERTETNQKALQQLAATEMSLKITKERLEMIEGLDRKCIAEYIKDRYSKTPTLIATAIAQNIVDLCEKHQMPTSLIVGVMETESHFNPYAKSSANATGLMQVIFKVWGKELGIKEESDLHELDKGIEYGILVLKRYLEQSEGNLKKALWMYNGRDKDHDKYANLVFTNVGRYILHKCRISFKMEDFDETESEKS